MDRKRQILILVVNIVVLFNLLVTARGDWETPREYQICPTGIPYGCTCNETKNATYQSEYFVHYSEVNCTNVSLTHIPADLPKPMVLRFTGNNFGVLNQVPDSYKNVITLRLNDNKITEIKDFVFKHLKNLRNLFISDSKLRDLSYDSFAGLNNLISLDMCNNTLYKLQTGIFRGEIMPKVKEIKLRNCTIYSLEPGVFLNASNLVYIGLDYNYLTKIPVVSVNSPLINLHVLELSHNSITNLRGLQNMPKLQTLLLCHNKLQHVADHAFDDVARSLAILDLSHNNIRTIEPTAFTKLVKLSELNLDHNKLKQVTWEELPWQQSLTRISLHHNEWSCDCHNAYLVEGHQKIDLYHAGNDSLKCASPKKVAGERMNDISKDHFYCGEHSESNAQRNALIVLSVVTSLLLLGIGVVVFRRMRQWKDTRKKPAGIYTKFSSKDSGMQYTLDF